MRSRAALVTGILVIAAAVSIGFVLARRSRVPVIDQATFTAMAESLEVASTAPDWDRAYDVAARLARLTPRHSGVIRKLAVALHNRTVAERVEHDVRRPAVRTSLERIERELTVLALLDSAAALASAPDDWAWAREWYGETLERLGLPFDALEVYSAIHERRPDFAPARVRIAWLKRRLAAP